MEENIEERLKAAEAAIDDLKSQLASLKRQENTSVMQKKTDECMSDLIKNSEIRNLLGGANRAKTRVAQAAKWMKEALEELDIVIESAESKLEKSAR